MGILQGALTNHYRLTVREALELVCAILAEHDLLYVLSEPEL